MGSIAVEEHGVSAPVEVLDALKLSSIVVEEGALEAPIKEEAAFQWHLPKCKTRHEITDRAGLHAERVTLQIKQLVLHGFLSQQASVANFRGVQYARIPARWYQAVPIDPTKEVGTIDATQWGPRCPQPMDVLHEATSHLYPRMSTFDHQSEFECLNLNIYSPSHQLGKKGRGLAVLVWIHGGSFLFGDGGCEYDGQYLVRRSIELEEPIIVVGINYRLGPLGVFSSKQLRDEARARGEAGFTNLGLHDQRIALQWVQKNIHFFGGDGSRITAAGESAGAVSILAHIRGQTPVFQNALIMSAANISPDPLATAQGNYDHLVSSIGLKEAPVNWQLSALRSLSPVEFLNLLGVTRHTFMIEDEEFFSDYSGQRFDQLTTLPSWLKAVIVGQTKDETVVFAHKWHSMSADEMRSQWVGLYDDPIYSLEVLVAYGVSEESSHSDMVAAMVAYTSDSFFNVTTDAIATEHLKLPGPANPKVYQYCFEQPDVLSTLDVWRGGAYHSLDIPFLFRHPQVAGEDAPSEFRATSDSFSVAAVRLVNGQEPWEDVSVAQRWMAIFADNSGIKSRGEATAARWAKLADTPERHQKFMLGMVLLGDAMGYALKAFSPAGVQRP